MRATHVQSDIATDGQPGGDPICPLCLRPIPKAARRSLHPLVAKLHGGKGGPTILIHKICHNAPHASLSEAEPARACNTGKALRAHLRLAKFAARVAKRPPDFHSTPPGARRRRRRG